MPPATGILRYDPRAQTPEGEVFDPWWLILEYDLSLLDQWRAAAEDQEGVRLRFPRWGAHISVVTGEPPRRKARWGFRNGEKVRFTYSETIVTDGIFYWLPVRSDELLSLRAYLGLPPIPRRGFHLTLGRIKTP